jgi:hypothetical protein
MFCQAQKNGLSRWIVLFLEPGCGPSHIIAALRDFSLTGKGIIAGLIPVHKAGACGGFVLHGALKEVNIPTVCVWQC